MHGNTKFKFSDAKQLPVPVAAAVSVSYTPDDGRMTPETCRESLQ